MPVLSERERQIVSEHAAREGAARAAARREVEARRAEAKEWWWSSEEGGRRITAENWRGAQLTCLDRWKRGEHSGRSALREVVLSQ